MAGVDFIIPLVRDDLRKRREVNQYVVDEVFPMRIIPSKLHDWRQAYRSGGALAIANHFDTVFSILVHLNSVDASTKRESWESVMKALVSEIDQLKTILELDPQDMEKPVRHEHLNCVKMLVYLLTQLADQLYQQAGTKIVEAKGRGKSTKDNSSEAECERAVQIILKLMELPIHKLWDPPVPEEEFINLVTNLCYKTLENSSINRNKSCRDACIHVVGVMIRRYNYSLAASVKLLQLVQNHEHLVAPLAQAVVVYATDYDTKSIVDDVVREISRMNIAESRDTSGMHHVAVFLSDIAEKGALVLLPHMARLTPFLDEESYQMRNCILSVMGEIMIQALGNDNLELRQKQARDSYLDHFEDHIHDVNAFVRSKTLQIWLQMINNKVVPLNRRHDLLELVLGRLQDVSSQVRKHAVQVVAALVKSDPFAAKLSLDDLQNNYEKEQEKLIAMMPEKVPEKQQNGETEAEEKEEDEAEKEKEVEETTEAVTDAEILNSSDQDQAEDSEPMDSDEVAKQKVLVQYLKDSVAFVSQVQRGSTLISQLLGSKSITDVLEAVDFFVTCSEFGLPSVEAGVRTMLNLVWSKETSVKEAVVRAYKRLYLEARTECPRNRAYAVVKNLCRLLMGATKGHMTSMEELMRDFMKSGEIDNAVIQMLWEVFTMKVPSSSSEESRLALTLLSMVASEAESVARTNINVIIEQGLGLRGETDLSLAKDACVLLLKIGNTKDKSENSEQFRLPLEHEVFIRLNHLLVNGFVNCNTRWIPFMEQAMDVIYKMAEHPDLFATKIIQRLAMEISQIMPAEQGGGDIFPGPIDEESRDSQGSEKDPVLDDIVPTDQLSFFLSICGHVALKQLVFLDVDVFGELKRRHQIMENKQEEQRHDKNSSKRRKSAGVTKKKEEDDDIGLGDAPNEDQDAEFIRRVCEDDIVTGELMLASVAPLIVSICSHPNLYPDEGLQSSAVLALAKYMLVSSVFCEERLPLLFTILERSGSSIIRANCIVALGDLTFRFPNLIEPWTPNLYACLRDDTPQVRRNTVMMLTHLILNDMVKVKGQISEMAVCILDEDTRIANLAKLFFSELATKGNAMYNILPDAISRLSDPDKGVDEQQFRDILKFLLSFIQKDRQCEGLVEKFCQRFQACRSDRQSRDLAFCLSLLQYSEKSLRKLLEHVGLYANTLGDAEVYRCFSVILTNGRKFNTAEAKSMLEELETRIEELHCKGATEEQIAANAKKASQAAKNFRRGGKGRGRSPKKLIKTEPADEPSPLIQAARQKRSTRNAPKQTLQFSESDDDLSSPVLKHKKPKPRKSRATFSSDSDD